MEQAPSNDGDVDSPPGGQDLAADSGAEAGARSAGMQTPAATTTTTTSSRAASSSDSSRENLEQPESSGSPVAVDSDDVNSDAEQGEGFALESDPMAMVRRPVLLHAALEYVWPRTQGFTREIGAAAIGGYIKLLQLHVTWHWNVAYLGDTDGMFRYKAWFGQPSRGRPLPFPVVNMYFELNSSVPTDHVESRFSIEEYHTIRNPREIFFREEWLDSTLDIKNRMIQSREAFMFRRHGHPGSTTLPCGLH